MSAIPQSFDSDGQEEWGTDDFRWTEMATWGHPSLVDGWDVRCPSCVCESGPVSAFRVLFRALI